jgi:hypothetical protein
MGLDSYWKLPKRKRHPNFDPPLQLCGGMLSGHGCGSFRGKVYDKVVEGITGVSLYQEEIDADTVMHMSNELNGTPYHTVVSQDLERDEDYDFDISESEYGDLQRMFKGYADKGATLHGWW